MKKVTLKAGKAAPHMRTHLWFVQNRELWLSLCNGDSVEVPDDVASLFAPLFDVAAEPRPPKVTPKAAPLAQETSS